MNNSSVDPITGINRTISGSSDFIIRTENLYAIANVEYDDKIIIDGLIRRDGSSLFGENNRWNTFYRISTTYRLTQDVKIKGIQELKLRASYGTAGDRPQFEYRFETYSQFLTKATLGNKDLRSALSSEFEVGTDISFLNRFIFNFSYSFKSSTKQFWNNSISAVEGGFRGQWINLDASIDVEVFEATLETLILSKRELKWRAGLVFTSYDQVLSKFNNTPERYGPGFRFYLKEGEQLGTLYGEKFARSIEDLSEAQKESDNYTINNEGFVVPLSTIGTVDEKPVKVEDEESNTQFVIGNIVPDFVMGLNSTFSWKGLELYFLIDWKKGGDLYNETKQGIIAELRSGVVDQSQVPIDQAKPVGYYTGFYNDGTSNDYFVEDASYVKLREVSLTYSLPQEILGGVFKEVKVGILGRNLLTFTNYSGYDPEVSMNFGLQNFGVDSFGYPNLSTITGLIELKF